MDVDRLKRSPIGRLIPIVGPDPVSHETVRGQAFLPDPLPTSVTLSTETWNTVNTATAALTRLDGAARRLPNPSLLRRPALRREAQSTSALEGTYAPFAEVLVADRDDGKHLTLAMREILNFELMAELGFSYPEERPITLGMLGALQRTLVRGTPGEKSDSGGIRDRIVVVGARGRELTDARYVPPPPGDQLVSGVEALLTWIAFPPAVPSVVQAAMTHYQFESLHPYSDGNGRLGRLLVILQLLRGAIIREPLLVVSPWFEQRREEYQEALFSLSCDGDWDAWTAFFAQGVAESASDSQLKVDRLGELQKELRSRVQGAGRRGTSIDLAEALVGSPYVSRSSVSDKFSLSGQGAQNAIDALVDLAILTPAGMRSRTGARMFVCNEVIEIIAA